MKTFLAIYLGSPSSSAKQKWDALEEKTRLEKQKAGMTAWMNWAAKNKIAIVDNGTPLGKTKLANANGISDIKNLMTAYTIIKAESHDAAAKIFADHPHFSIFPGEAVEIMECLPMPQL